MIGKLFQCVEHELGVFGIDVARGFVSEHYPQVFDEGAGNGYALLLRAGALNIGLL